MRRREMRQAVRQSVSGRQRRPYGDMGRSVKQKMRQNAQKNGRSGRKERRTAMGIPEERYSRITAKNQREICLLRGFPCAWGKCAFCDYIEDNGRDREAMEA